MFEFEGRSLKYKESNCLEKRGRRELSVAVGPVANVFDASHENILFCFFSLFLFVLIVLEFWWIELGYTVWSMP